MGGKMPEGKVTDSRKCLALFHDCIIALLPLCGHIAKLSDCKKGMIQIAKALEYENSPITLHSSFCSSPFAWPAALQVKRFLTRLVNLYASDSRTKDKAVVELVLQMWSQVRQIIQKKREGML
jgi:hypothetical protein